MPAKKREWVMGPDGQLVQKGAKVARQAAPVRGQAERLTDGLSRGGYGVSGAARPGLAQLLAAREQKPWLAEAGLRPRPRAPDSTGGSSGSACGSSAASALSSARSATPHAGSTSASLAQQYQTNEEAAAAAAVAANAGGGGGDGGRVRQRPRLATGTRASAGSSATQSLLATPVYSAAAAGAPGANVPGRPGRPAQLNAQARHERKLQGQAQTKMLERDNKNLRPGEKEAKERAKRERRTGAARESGHTADQADPENLELSLADLMSRARTEAAQPASLPPVLRCLPGGLPGNSACLPAGSAALMGSALPPWCFEVRAPMKMGRLARHHVTVAGDACTGPPGSILLSSSTMHVLGATADEDITLRRVPDAPRCERLVLEAAASAAIDTPERREALEAAVRALLSEEANGYGVLSKGEVFQVQSRGHKCRVVDVLPSSPALMPPREIVFKQAKPVVAAAAAAATAASSGEGGGGDGGSSSQEELSVAPDQPGTLRVVTSGQDASARLRVAATGGVAGASCVLRLAVRTRGRAAAPLAPAVLYVTRGDTPPTVEEGGYTWGGAGLVDCEMPEEGGADFNVLVRGEACYLVAHVHKRVPSAAAAAAVVDDGGGGGGGGRGASNVHDDVLTHFTAIMRVPSPEQLQGRLPTGTDLLYLHNLDKLLGIESARGTDEEALRVDEERAKLPYEAGCYTVPHAREWAQCLPARIATKLPLQLRLSLVWDFAHEYQFTRKHTHTHTHTHTAREHEEAVCGRVPRRTELPA